MKILNNYKPSNVVDGYIGTMKYITRAHMNVINTFFNTGFKGDGGDLA